MSDFEDVAAEALKRAHELVPRWLEDGYSEGGEWVARNPNRADKRAGSFRVNLNSGEWGDFATGDKGGDLISLNAFLFFHGQDKAQYKALRSLAEELRVTLSKSAPGSPAARDPAPRKPSKNDPVGMLFRPAPDDAPPFTPVLDDQRLGRSAAHWVYRDAAGKVLMVIVRWNTVEDGEPAKIIRQFTCWRLDEPWFGREPGVHWLMKWIDRPRPIYNLDKLAAKPSAPVLVCEGEKAAEAAALLFPDHIATTSPGGNQNASLADWSPLAGRRVVIWPDADLPKHKLDKKTGERLDEFEQPGMDYARRVARACRDVRAASVLMVDFAYLKREIVACAPAGEGLF